MIRSFLPISGSGHPLHCQPMKSEPSDKEKKVHIKKPLNAFMLFMKDQRAKVVAECTLKESAAINQILGEWDNIVVFTRVMSERRRFARLVVILSIYFYDCAHSPELLTKQSKKSTVQKTSVLIVLNFLCMLFLSLWFNVVYLCPNGILPGQS